MREDKKDPAKKNFFISIHHNHFAGSSFQECASRIVICVYSKQNEATSITINDEDCDKWHVDRLSLAMSENTNNRQETQSCIPSTASSTASSVSSVQCSDNRKNELSEMQLLKMKNIALERELNALKSQQKNGQSQIDDIRCSQSSQSSQGSQACTRAYVRSKSMDDIKKKDDAPKLKRKLKAAHKEITALKIDNKRLQKDNERLSKNFGRASFVHFTPPNFTPPTLTPPNPNNHHCKIKEPALKKRKIDT